jgi:hypothetical protein
MQAGNVTERRGDSPGNAALFVLLLVPVLLLCGVFAVDLSRYRSFASSLERDANATALQAAFQLPDAERARTVLERFRPNTSRAERESDSERINGRVVDYRINEDLSSVSLTLQARFETGIGRYLAALNVPGFSVTKTVSAGLQPVDAVLIVADGSTLRPGLEPGGAKGTYRLHQVFRSKDDSNTRFIDWPEAEYLHHCKQPSPKYKSRFSGTKFEQWATQACFNPVYSPLKIAAISLVDALSAYGANRLSVFFTPGSGRGVTIVRPLLGPSAAVKSGSGYFERAIASAEALWTSPRESNAIITDEDCVLFSDEAASGPGPLPNFFLGAAPPPFLRKPELRLRPILFPQCGENFENRRPVELDRRFLDSSLLLREALYWHAAQAPDTRSSPPGQQLPQILAAVKRAVPELRNATSGGSSLLDRGRRAARREIIVLTDVLDPVPDEERQLLAAALAETEAKLTIVLWEHSQVPPSVRRISDRGVKTWNEVMDGNGGGKVIRFSAGKDDVTAAAYQLIETVSKPLASSLKVAVLRE